jgi:hypothetical protein
MKPATSAVVTEASSQHGQKSRCVIVARFYQTEAWPKLRSSLGLRSVPLTASAPA